MPGKKRTKATGNTRDADQSQRYMVPVVRSTFRILEELSRSGTLGLNDVTQRTKVSKSTVFRILTTLTNLGYVIRDDERNYQVSPSLGDLVNEVAAVEVLRRVALPHMLRLRDNFGETVNLGRLELDKVKYVEVVPSEYALRLHETPGATVHLHASALGKVILAFSDPEFAASLLRGRELPILTRNTVTDAEELLGDLRRIRERGYAFDRGEISPLATCVAAPILDGARHAIAAISISGPASRFNPKSQSPVIESLIMAAAEIGAQLKSRAKPAASQG